MYIFTTSELLLFHLQIKYSMTAYLATACFFIFCLYDEFVVKNVDRVLV